LRRLVALSLLILLLAGCGTSAPRKPVIAVLLTDDIRMPKVEGLRAGLADLGYSPDSLQVEVYSAKGDRTALPALASRAVESAPTVLVAGGGVEALALKVSGNTRIPVVMIGVASTVRSQLVASFAHPGGLITGLDNQHAELSAKRLELLTRLLPHVERVLLLYDPLVIPGQHALEVTQEAAGRLGVSVTPLAVESVEQALDGLRPMQPGDFDAALLLPGFVLESGARQITQELERLRLPVMGPLDLEGESGLLAAYGVSMRAQGMQSARFVAKILQGEEPGAIPVETPDNPELIVDLAVAERLGVQLSPVGMAFARTRGEARE